MDLCCVVFCIALSLFGAAESLSVYGRYETCVTAGQVKYRNPFNYTEVVTKGIFTGPDGNVAIDGFYYQNYTRSNAGGSEKLNPYGSPQWCVRYSPRHSGSFKVIVTITNSSGTFILKTDSFEAVKGTSAGFIKCGPNKVHFEFTNGSTYYPVGENVCWVGENQGTYGYDNYFGKLAENGGNYARLWLTDSAFDDLAVEVNVGNMSLSNTWRLDYVVELAEKLNIHLLMCTESFNYFCASTASYCEWNICYYNVANGGFLTKPSDFFTDERAKADYKNRLRYIVARYGYSTSVFAWEFFNEVDGTDNYDGSVQIQWTEEMTSFVHSVDVYNHLISTSYAHSDGDVNVQALSALNFTMTHNYGSNDIAVMAQQYVYKKRTMYKKPTYVAEFGIGNQDNDKTGVSLHNGLWAPLFVIGAGTSMTWWWDSWVEPNNLYHIFKPISTFVSRLQLSSYDWFLISPLIIANTTYDLRTWGMSGVNSEGKEMIVAWIQDDCYTWAHQNAGQSCATLSGIMLSVNCSLISVTYTGHWFNTHTGEDITTTTMSCDNHLKDGIPTFSQDIAVYYTS